MPKNSAGGIAAVLAVLAAVIALQFGLKDSVKDSPAPARQIELLNVSYDVSRRLWRDLNAAFIPAFAARTGIEVNIKQSHGGSAAQARAVVDGLDADVVTLNLWTDTDVLRETGADRARLGNAAS